MDETYRIVYCSNNISKHHRTANGTDESLHDIFMTPNLVLQTSFLQKSTCASRARSDSIFAAQICTISILQNEDVGNRTNKRKKKDRVKTAEQKKRATERETAK